MNQSNENEILIAGGGRSNYLPSLLRFKWSY